MAAILDFFLIGTILAILDLQVIRCFLLSFKSISLLVREKKRKIDFQDGGHGSHLDFPIGMVLAIFDLQITPYASYCFTSTGHSLPSADSRRAVVSFWRKNVHNTG